METQELVTEVRPKEQRLDVFEQIVKHSIAYRMGHVEYERDEFGIRMYTPGEQILTGEGFNVVARLIGFTPFYSFKNNKVNLIVS